ncbi:HAMP domain-containing methyl-accepting chemotaxis protein [Sporosarcina jeotgali]|uniref:HAMP domain-containing methyl-accepting chemotaxis protein n=1 Tax=Sporosarcina jeotgali TaxID=3020056 RepID=A0ABZ0KX32_9BACL|nr:HAMP domain-containing methyl-accepting chemotaxis protein [Sporosarcina sp. B2O-1]WOV84954.1 HAMP domain-containing methyl-accepting chemotaxis protein [Sporosarcina sp. B2O-1]
MKRTIAGKLRNGFGLLLVLLVVIGAASILLLVKLNNDYKNMLDDEVHKVDIVDEFVLKQEQMQSDIRGYMLYQDETMLERRQQNYERSEQLIQELGKMMNGAKMKKEYEALVDSNEKSMTLQNNIVDNLEQGKDDIAKWMSEASKDVGNVVMTRADMIKDNQYKALETKRKEVNQMMVQLTIIIAAIIMIAVVAGVLISRRISRSITKPVAIVTEGLHQIADGNFSIDPLVVRSKDEVGEMANAFNKMGADVASMIRKINVSAEQLAMQSEELSASSEESLASSELIASTAEQQLEGSERQQRITDQSTQSMSELSIGVGEISESNEDMLRSAEAVTQLVGKGSASMDEVVNEMKTIRETIRETAKIMKEMADHSSEIEKVTAIITGIAEQTNLLALNAAIEAARAGDAGKGFAVVADEVRKLAEQSKSSASEIGTMVSDIQVYSKKATKSIETGNEKVENGMKATAESNAVFKDIQQAVGDVAAKVETVSAAIEEIQAMADEVTEGAREVQRLSGQASISATETSSATEEQLAVSEEISASAQSLTRLADELQQEVSRFQV